MLLEVAHCLCIAFGGRYFWAWKKLWNVFGRPSIGWKEVFVTYSFKKQHRENSFQRKSQNGEKNLHFFGHCGNRPNCVWFRKPRFHLLGQQGELGQQRDSFRAREQTSKDLPAAKYQDFAIPIFSHGLNSRDICSGRSVEGELPNPVVPLGSLHCLGCPCPSALPAGCYFYITHVWFFCVDQLFHEETSQKMPQQLEPCCGDVWQDKEAPLGRGSGFEHAHIVSVKGQTAC